MFFSPILTNLNPWTTVYVCLCLCGCECWIGSLGSDQQSNLPFLDLIGFPSIDITPHFACYYYYIVYHFTFHMRMFLFIPLCVYLILFLYTHTHFFSVSINRIHLFSVVFSNLCYKIVYIVGYGMFILLWFFNVGLFLRLLLFSIM